MVFKKKDSARTGRFALRMLPEELEAVTERARLAGMSTSEFIRRSAMGQRVAVRHDTEVVTAIRDLLGTVGDLRDVVKSTAQFDAEDFRKIAAECIATMQRMI